MDDEVVSEILFDPINSLNYATIKLFLEMGLNVIIDTIIYDDKRFNELHDLLMDLPALFVGAMCSRDGLIRREHIIGDRALGLALYQYDKVYSFDEYDFKVNTEKLGSAECGDKIFRFKNHDLSTRYSRDCTRERLVICRGKLNNRFYYWGHCPSVCPTDFSHWGFALHLPFLTSKQSNELRLSSKSVYLTNQSFSKRIFIESISLSNFFMIVGLVGHKLI